MFMLFVNPIVHLPLFEDFSQIRQFVDKQLHSFDANMV